MWDIILSEDYIGDWIAFIGSVIGGLLGGVFTIGALWWTLRYYRKKDKQEDIENEEKKRLSIIPFLTGKDYALLGIENPIDVYFHSLENGSMNLFSCYIEVKNVGLSTSVDITFPKLYPFRNANVDNDNISLPVGESIIIHLQADIRTPEGIGNVTWLTIRFLDLLGNTYEQALSLDINYQTRYFKAAGTFQPQLVKK